MKAFASGSASILVASDLAARGLHIDGISHVFHFDIPENPLDYQHRCGRTGRLGQVGTSVALSTEYELDRLREFEKTFSITVVPQSLHHGKVQLKRR